LLVLFAPFRQKRRREGGQSLQGPGDRATGRPDVEFFSSALDLQLQISAFVGELGRDAHSLGN
jgi:hypothetical protein